ncbi:MAG: D-tyrosyl-tRNA(Tyr) deacylase [Lachnospiraceae bacterium]|nr:D-tyrosyl-tRNA(Tyr) deacylase [Lachnospiraceae bacterium]
MRFVIQRVKKASVTVYEEDAAGKVLSEGKVTGSIEKGYMVLVGACQSDTKEIADKMVRKMLGLRIFEDAEGKTNLSLESVGGKLLLVSQFTLYADCRKGNRPSFLGAGDPAHAEDLYNYVVGQCRAAGFEVQTGVFGAEMDVELVNDGPFTIILDSDSL